MNKKIIGAGVAVVLVGAFVYLGYVETKIEETVRAKIAHFPVLVEDIEYNAISDVLHLNNLVFKDGSEDSNFKLSVNTLSITGCNTDILNADEEFPLVFSNVVAKGLNIDFKSNDEISANIMIDSFSMDDYAHNIVTLIKEYEADWLAEAYFEALTNYKHDGIEIKGAKFTFKDVDVQPFMSASVELIKVEEIENHHLALSADYENIEFSDDNLDLKIGSFSLDDVQLFDAKALSRIAQALFGVDTLVQEQGDQAYNDIINNLYDYLDYSNRSFASKASMKDMKFLLKNAYIEDIKDKEISIKNFSLDLESGEKPSVVYILEDLAMSPEYVSLLLSNSTKIIDPLVVDKIVNAFITDKIVINMNNKTELDSANNVLTFENSTSVSSFFENFSKGTAIYKGQDFWNLFNINSDDTLNLVAYKKIKNNYTDKGFIPLVVNVIVAETGLPLESFIELVKSQMTVASGMLQTGQENIDAVIEDALQAVITMFDKPGSLDIDAQFNTPYTMLDVLENPPTDFEVDINVEQGDKTIIELTPASLLSE